MKRKRLNFKARDYITGELKNVGYMEMRGANDPEEPEEEPEEPGAAGEPEEEPEEEPGFTPGAAEEPEEPEEPEEEPVDLYFYGDIGGAAWQTEDFAEDKCPQDVLDFFNAIPPEAPVNVYMNSGGGDAYAGVAIASMIRRHKGRTTGHVDGLAASIASVIVCGCDKVVVHTGGQFMMHKPLTIALGNADDFKVAIKRLDACQDCITDVYMSHAKAGITRDAITKLINAETWLGATTAQRYFDFETDTKPAAIAAKSGYMSEYKHAPRSLTGEKKPAAGTQDMVEAITAALEAWETRKKQQEERELQDILNSLDKYGA